MASQGSAPRVKLYKHRDFDQAVLHTAAQLAAEGLRAAIIEKDYYVTEALRIVAAAAGERMDP